MTAGPPGAHPGPPGAHSGPPATDPGTPTRLDLALVARGLVRSRTRAAREIAAGRVFVDDRAVTRPAHPTHPDARLEVRAADPWVARSAHKLLGALADLDCEDAPRGAICLDAGASTGGFTQVLLARGARRVHAIDVGHEQLDPTLRTDPRVRSREGHNLRALEASWLAPDTAVDLVVADVSFISLTLVLERLLAVTRPGGLLLLMVKPQFELSRAALDKHGVAHRARDRAAAVVRVVEEAARLGAELRGWAPSRLPGPTGNREYFVCVRAPLSVGSSSASPEPQVTAADISRRISEEDT